MQEKRSHQRVRIDAEATVEVTGQAPFTGLARDISLGGIFIESDQVLKFDTKVVVVCSLPSERTPLRLPGVVRWNTPKGFGVQFGLLGARETHAITNFSRH